MDGLYEPAAQPNESSSSISALISFVAGGLIGSLVTLYFAKKYYKKLADDEIQSTVDAFEEMKQRAEEIMPKPQDDVPDQAPAEKPNSKSEIISGESFRNDMDYDKEYLTYFDVDGILCDSYDRELFISDLFDPEFLTKFGWEKDDDEDILCVRNYDSEVDYEITREHKPYLEVIGEQE